MIYRICLTCVTLHEGVEATGDMAVDGKYDHCSVCFEDYDQFRDATHAEVAKKRGKKLNKILLDE